MEDIHPIQILKDRLQNRDISYNHRIKILDLFKQLIRCVKHKEGDIIKLLKEMRTLANGR